MITRLNCSLVDTLIELYAFTDYTYPVTALDMLKRYTDIRMLIIRLQRTRNYPASDITNLKELEAAIYSQFTALFDHETFDPYGLNALIRTKRKVYNG